MQKLEKRPRASWEVFNGPSKSNNDLGRSTGSGLRLFLHRKLSENITNIAVLNAETKILRELHGREVKDIKVSMERIFEKLDSIEQSTA